MEDSLLENENLVHPMNLSPKGASKVGEDHEVDVDKKDHEAEGGEERQAGFISHLLSNIVSGGEAEEAKEHDEDGRGIFGDDKYEGKGGGLISHYISNLVSPLVSPKAEKSTGKSVEVPEVENGSSKIEEDVDGGGGGNGGRLKQRKIEEKDGGGGGHGVGAIIDNLVSHLPASLPGKFL